MLLFKTFSLLKTIRFNFLCMSEAQMRDWTVGMLARYGEPCPCVSCGKSIFCRHCLIGYMLEAAPQPCLLLIYWPSLSFWVVFFEKGPVHSFFFLSFSTLLFVHIFLATSFFLWSSLLLIQVFLPIKKKKKQKTKNKKGPIPRKNEHFI